MSDIVYDTDEKKIALLKNLYYVKHLASGRDSLFYYISKVLDIKTIARRYIGNWLSKQNSQQLYAKPKQKTTIRPIISKRQNGIIQVDLIDYSNKKFQGYCYILNVIDIFSRRCWLVALKNKEAITIDSNFKTIMDEIQKDHKISVIQSDNGLEFSNIKNIPDIKHIQSQPHTFAQNGYVERSNNN